MAKLKTHDEPVVDVVVEHPKPSKQDPILSELDRVVALIATKRKAQVAGAKYLVSGNEMCAYIDGSIVVKVPLVSIGGKPAVEKSKAIAASELEGYGRFVAEDILQVNNAGSVFKVVSNDGRKYVVDLKTGQVS